MKLTCRAPATGAVVGELPTTAAEDVRGVVARARRAQTAWGVLPVAERVVRLRRFADALVEHVTELVDLVVEECGRPRPDALAHELTVAVDLVTFTLANAERVLAPREVPLHLFRHKKSTVHYGPRGVVGIVAAFDQPLAGPLVDVVTALVTGSAAVVKPSEHTPRPLRRAKALFDASGLPEDLFQLVQGGPAVALALARAGIQRMMFTGTTAAGREIAAACGAELVPTVLALAGNAPLLACADADVERTARAIVHGAFANAGQTCLSVTRVYAHAAIHDVLLARVAELTRALRVGDPAAAEPVDIGALAHPRSLERARDHVADALDRGARVVVGGAPAGPTPGRFFAPTVLAGCDATMAVMREETYAPVVAFQEVPGDDEALRLANASPLGLGAYVFTRDRDRARRLADRLEAGSVVVNDVLVGYAVAEAPFGGTKQSGHGRIHGEEAIRDMAETKHVVTTRFLDPPTDPLWLPYSARSYPWQLRLFRTLYGRGVVRKLRSLL